SVVGNATINKIGTIGETAEEFARQSFKYLQPSTPLQKDFTYSTSFIELPQAKINYAGCGMKEKETATKLIKNLVSIDFRDLTPRFTKLAWFSLEDNYFFLVPGEPLMDFKLRFESRLKAEFPEMQNVTLISVANDYLGYMMMPENYSEQSLETCSTFFGSSLSETIIDGFINMLKEKH
ncbi:MAG: hypothetical protein K2X39_04400, partial [Silvanigrellaceae bacterium]|nr:hypothetical protein [Silvanigrellaceae bacterium]